MYLSYILKLLKNRYVGENRSEEILNKRRIKYNANEYNIQNSMQVNIDLCMLQMT